MLKRSVLLNILRVHCRSFERAIMTSFAAITYPQARRDMSIKDNYHGYEVVDPYRWMEDPDAEETKQFVDDLNKITIPFLEACPIRGKIEDRLKEIWNYPKYGCTSKHGDFYFYSYNSGLQNHSVMYIQDSLDGPGRVFLDPNEMSEDGTTAVTSRMFNEEGNILAYGICERGSDWTSINFKKVPCGTPLDDELTKLRYSGVSWLNDSSGLFYSMYPHHSKEASGNVTEKNEFHSLYFHTMGTTQDEDQLCVEFPDHPHYMLGGEVTEDGNYLVVDVDKGCDPCNLIYYYDLDAVNYKISGKLDLKPIVDEFHCKISYVVNDGPQFLMMTNSEAPMFKLVHIDIHNPAKENWVTVVPENLKAKLDWAAAVAGDKLILCYMEDVKNVLYLHCLKTGRQLGKLPLDLGTVTGFFGRLKLKEIFYSFQSDLNPGTIYRCLLCDEKPQPQVLRQIEIPGFDLSGFKTEQVFFPSKDGTRIPMFLLHAKNLELNGSNPTILYGYGGFNLPVPPCFSLSRLMFIGNMGGIYAVANLRGGSEYGEKWHEAGMKEKKQNVFDDFLAAAEYLIAKNYTSPKRLISHGGSNGGLVVAACANQRPDLFAAVLNRVGVMDMYRYHKFTIGEAWVPEFGSSDVKEEFEYLRKYSPLHNLRLDVDWFPSMLLTTADHDDRVVPLHSLKYIAELYHLLAQTPKHTNPVLARIEVKAGHGAGKPTAKIIEELVDIYSYVARILNLEWKQ